jgi:hypothetical protein
MPAARPWARLGAVNTPSLGALALEHPLLVPSAYLVASTVGAGFALNAHRPLARDGSLSISVFFAGWLTAELPLHHLAWQLAATAAFAWAGALGSWPGWEIGRAHV